MAYQPTPLTASIQMQKAPTPPDSRIHMAVDKPDSKIGDVVFATYSHGKTYDYNPNKKLKKECLKSAEELWEAVKKTLPQGASSLVINLSQMTIRYIFKGDIAYVSMKAEPFKGRHIEILELTQKVRELAKKVGLVGGTASGIDDTVNRSRNGPAPLEVISRKWQSKMPGSLSDFEQKGFLEKVLSHLKTNGKDPEKALKKLKATERFVDLLESKVRALRVQKQKAIKQLEARVSSSLEKQALQRERENLANIERKCAEFDRLATFIAVSFTGDLDPKSSPEKKIDTANEISGFTINLLKTRLGPGRDDRSLFTKTKDKILRRNSEEAEALKGLTPFKTAYGLDAGDLALHDAALYYKRAEEMGAPHKTVSFEEFLTNAMMQDPKEFDAEEAVLSLGIRFDPATQKELGELIKTSLQEAVIEQGA